MSSVMAVTVILHTCDIALLQAALEGATGGASDFFENEFALIDVSTLGEGAAALDWPALLARLKSFSLLPVAVRHAPPDLHARLATLGLGIDTTERAHAPLGESMSEAAPAPVETPPPAPEVRIEHLPAMVVDTPVRAGQRIYARGADLIITAAVNNGAEVIADGSIHIYAPLRGRALAGARGNTAARIFAQGMEPELVSIAGIYRTFENGYPDLPAHQPAQVRLVGERIEVSSLKSAG